MPARYNAFFHAAVFAELIGPPLKVNSRTCWAIGKQTRTSWLYGDPKCDRWPLCWLGV